MTPRMLAGLVLALVSCLLLGCAAGLQPTPDPSLTAPVPVPPPASLLTPPPPLPPPRSGRLGDLEANHLEVTRRYHQLASQLCQLLAYLQAPVSGCPLSPPPFKRQSNLNE